MSFVCFVNLTASAAGNEATGKIRKLSLVNEIYTVESAHGNPAIIYCHKKKYLFQYCILAFQTSSIFLTAPGSFHWTIRTENDTFISITDRYLFAIQKSPFAFVSSKEFVYRWIVHCGKDYLFSDK